MKKKILKKVLISVAVFIFAISALISIIIFPSLHYKHKTQFEQLTIYHQKPLNENYQAVLKQSLEKVENAEIYDKKYQLDICLNDGSRYPKIIERIKGAAFGHGFYNKVVMNCTIDWDKDVASLHGRNWKLNFLLAHEMIHCYQFNSFGFSTLGFPNWKLEGYPEYVNYIAEDNQDLKKLIELFLKEKALKGNNNWHWMMLNETIGVPYTYFKTRILTTYMINIKGLTYQDFLNDNQSEKQIEKAMLNWSLNN